MSQVPSNIFICVGFRVRTEFKVSGTSDSVLTVYEPQDKGETQQLHGNTHTHTQSLSPCVHVSRH